MHIVLTAKQMKMVDQHMIRNNKIPGLLLMENAAMGVCDVIMGQEDPCVVHVFCGIGNNGGDGLAAARILLTFGYDVYVVVAGTAGNMSEDAKTNYGLFSVLEDRVKCISGIAEFDGWDVPEADVIVDALLGTGITRDVDGLYRSLVNHINRQSDAFVVSVDIPSGINTDTGAVMGSAVKAGATVTFQYPKFGHYLYPGREYTGDLEIIPIGIDDGCDVLENPKACVYENPDDDICLPQRSANTNKGDYGRLLLVAGSQGMAGAAILSARAAARAGAGLVTVGAGEDVLTAVQHNVPEATCKILPSENGALVKHSVFEIARIIKGKSAIAAGPGLGTGDDIQDIILHLVTNYPVTKVIDADGVNVLAGKLETLLKKEGELILTPHPKEFARMTDMDLTDVLKNPVTIAAAFAKEFSLTLVLKGATTIIADQTGRVALVSAGSPGMAKGGSGDVLTGVIAGLAAQGKTAFDSALLGVYFCAAAGELAAQEVGEYAMTPQDTISYLGYAMQEAVTDCPYNDADAVVSVREDDINIELPEAPATVQEDAGNDTEDLEITAVHKAVDPQIVEKTAEDALAEIEEKEKTQEIKKEILEEIKEGSGDDPDKPTPPTRRRIG